LAAVVNQQWVLLGAVLAAVVNHVILIVEQASAARCLLRPHRLLFSSHIYSGLTLIEVVIIATGHI
jgi:hypothetical protein